MARAPRALVLSMSLTPRQRDLLIYIDGHIKAQGCAPSYDEMCVAIGIASKSGIHRLVNGLEERGYLRRWYGRRRSIEVIRMPGDPPPPLSADDAIARYKSALAQIAAGQAYGEQAQAQKEIARKALGWG